jgi:hypothetical protein
MDMDFPSRGGHVAKLSPRSFSYLFSYSPYEKVDKHAGNIDGLVVLQLA